MELWTFKTGGGSSKGQKTGTFSSSPSSRPRLGGGFSSSRPSGGRISHGIKRPIVDGVQLAGFATLSLKVTGLVPTFPDGTQVVVQSEAERRRQRAAGPTLDASKAFVSLSQDQIKSMQLEIEILKCELEIAEAQKARKEYDKMSRMKGLSAANEHDESDVE